MKNTSSQQTQELLDALDKLNNTSLIFTMPNADIDGLKIYDKIIKFTRERKYTYFFKSLDNKNILVSLNKLTLLWEIHLVAY